jgi:hypothetical protein
MNKNLWIALAATIIMIMTAGSTMARGDLASLTTPPADTADAERVRIWVGAERANSCRLTIDIYNTAGGPVRSLIDEVLAGGYYNFYWDKRDDSGKFVPPGDYVYRLNDCGKRKGGNLEVVYRSGERAVSFTDSAAADTGVVCFLIHNDSLPISIGVYRGTRRIDTPVQDSSFSAGPHTFIWQPSGSVRPGRYRIEIAIGDFIHALDFRRPL